MSDKEIKQEQVLKAAWLSGFMRARNGNDDYDGNYFSAWKDLHYLFSIEPAALRAVKDAHKDVKP